MRRSLLAICALCILWPAASYAADGTWTDLTPPWRILEGLRFDPSTNHLVTFSGLCGMKRTDFWEGTLDGSWTNPSTSGDAPPAGSCRSFDDPIRGRVIVLAINDLANVWILTLPTRSWQHLSASNGPLGRLGYVFAYDAVRDRLLLIGGQCCGSNQPTYLSDVWSLPLAGPLSWSQISTGPHAGSDINAVIDPLGDRLIVHGGFGGNNDTWAMSLNTLIWQKITSVSAEPVTNASFFYSVMDTLANRMLVLGSPNSYALSLTPPTTWTNLPTSNALVENRGAAVFDSTGNRVIGYPPLWTLNLDPAPQWAVLDSMLRPPVTPPNHSGYDPDHDRMLLWSQSGGTTTLWELPLAPGGGWRVAGIANPGISAGDYASTIVDVAGKRLIVFGDNGGVWQLPLNSNPVWSQVPVSGGPPLVRYGYATIYDPVSPRVVAYGGQDGNGGQVTSEVWTLSLGPSPAWHLETTTSPIFPPPTPRVFAEAIDDPVRRRMMIHGGLGPFNPQETWALLLDNMQWVPLNGAGPVTNQDAFYDPIGDRMVTYGGKTWVFPLATDAGWSLLSPAGEVPSDRDRANLVYDPLRDRMIAFGGATNDGYGDGRDTRILDWGRMGPTDAVPIANGFSLEAPYPNPGTASLSLSFVLDGVAPARLEVIEVSGRLAATRDLSGYGPGRHAVSLSGEKLAPGVYLVRLRQGERSAAVKAIVLN